VKVQKDPPRDHHIVPAGYLRNFKNAENDIFACKVKDDRLHVKVRKTSEMGIAYVRDFYKVDVLPWDSLGDEENAYEVETKINQSYENDIPEYWKVLTDGRSNIHIGQKHRIVEIIVHLKYRNSFIRNTLYSKDNMYEVFKAEKLAIKNSPDSSLLEQRKHFGSDFDLYLDLAFEMWVGEFEKKGGGILHNRALKWREGNDTSIRKAAIWRLAQSDWTIFEASDDSVIVSDNPGFAVHKGKIFNFLATGDFELYFPINSCKVLHIKSRKDVIDEASLNQLNHSSMKSELVSFVNNQTVLYASLEIYGSKKSTIELYRDIYRSSLDYKS